MKPFEGREISPQPFVERLKSNEIFQKLAVPIIPGKFPIIRDAEFYIAKSGFIVNAEGWHHPAGKLIGEVLYAPDEEGDRTIFGQKYRKVTLYPGTYTPIPYIKRQEALSKYDLLGKAGKNPYFAQYKQIFNRDDFVAYLPAHEVLQKIAGELATPEDTISLGIQYLQRLLDINLSNIALGVTGGSLVGNFRNLHDLDIVFQGSLEENLKIAKEIRNLVKRSSYRRVIEGGKGWNIRFYNEDRSTLMCSFFSYKNPEDAPLRNFEMEVIAPDLTIEGNVVDDTHSIYTPTVLGLDQVRITKVKDLDVDIQTSKSLQLIAYHTATRGECFAGDRVKARGALVNIKTPKGEHGAICVIDREGVRNLTPTWKNFYDDPDVFK